MNARKAQIINKWKTMKKKYKEVVDQNGKTGNSKTTWKYYELFYSAYGNKAGTQAKITYDSERKEKLKIGKNEATPSEHSEDRHMPKAGPSKRKSEIETMSDELKFKTISFYLY